MQNVVWLYTYKLLWAFLLQIFKIYCSYIYIYSFFWACFNDCWRVTWYKPRCIGNNIIKRMLGKFKFSRHPIRCTHHVTCRACAQKTWVQLDLCILCNYSVSASPTRHITSAKQMPIMPTRVLNVFAWKKSLLENRLKSEAKLYILFSISIPKHSFEDSKMFCRDSRP